MLVKKSELKKDEKNPKPIEKPEVQILGESPFETMFIDELSTNAKKASNKKLAVVHS